VAHVMRHEAGLANFDSSFPLEAMTVAGIKGGLADPIIARQVPRWKKDASGRNKREYHAVTRGLIVNEIGAHY
jgi:hypothetical protein